MPSDNRRSPSFLFGLLVYLAVIGAALGVAALRWRGGNGEISVSPAAIAAEEDDERKPYFSLSTNRTYGTYDRARVWINYQKVDHLDFRIYRVKDPVKFFKNLEDPHQMGEDEKAEVSASYQRQPSLLEKLRALKRTLYLSIKSYFRYQLKRSSRTTFNQKFREGGERVPLNVADSTLR